jgi:hypothetical protein
MKNHPKLFGFVVGDNAITVMARTLTDARALLLKKFGPQGVTAEHLRQADGRPGPITVVSMRRPPGSFPLSPVLYQHSPALLSCLPKWEAAMGSCFHFEVAVRLLAQKSATRRRRRAS